MSVPWKIENKELIVTNLSFSKLMFHSLFQAGFESKLSNNFTYHQMIGLVDNVVFDVHDYAPPVAVGGDRGHVGEGGVQEAVVEHDVVDHVGS